MSVRFLEEILQQLQFLELRNEIVRKPSSFNIGNDRFFDLGLNEIAHFLSDFLHKFGITSSWGVRREDRLRKSKLD